jgi:hypothetical protein
VRALALCLLLAGCASLSLTDELEPEVVLTPEVKQLMALLHPRMIGHGTLPDRELLMCLSGHVIGHRVHVTGVSPTRLHNMTEIGMEYSPCSRGAIGSWHTHPTLPGMDTCRHSATDIRTFERQPFEIVSIVTCTDGHGVRIVPVVKRGYQRWRG